MNNDIFKFRVWDKDHYVRGLYTLNEDGYITDGRRIIVSCLGMVIERCTGMKDKNGRLIYEGDVVEYTFSDGKKAQWFIVWNDELYKFAQCNVQWVKNEMMELGNNFSMEHYIFFDSAGIRKETLSGKVIVGNIHETKWGIESEVKE